MKKIFTIIVICLFASACIQAQPNAQIPARAKPAKNLEKTVVWTGLDYSLVRMIGGSKFQYGFNVPALIFPGMLERWNQLFLDERLQGLEVSLGVSVSIDTTGVTDRNKTATEDQIILSPGSKDVIEESHITPEIIDAEIQGYKMTSTNGLGLVFIVDRMLYTKHEKYYRPQNPAVDIFDGAGAIYVVWFDVATRKVISTKRVVYHTYNSTSFRNFWFGPIKDADSELKLPKQSSN